MLDSTHGFVNFHNGNLCSNLCVFLVAYSFFVIIFGAMCIIEYIVLALFVISVSQTSLRLETNHH